MNNLFLNQSDDSLFTYKFIKNSQEVETAPLCGMTLRAAGSMRFRWNEVNQNRIKTLQKIAEIRTSFSNQGKTVVPVELIHSQIVYDVSSPEDTENLQGDGIVTKNRSLMPVVTVADCVPIYFYEETSGVFGIVHSGWKGTGIVEKAIVMAEEKYGAKRNNFCIIIGPHIHDCCYIVNQERADYFANQFSPDCVKPLEANGKCFAGGRGLAIEWDNGESKLYRLSLLQANLSVLKKLGIPDENIRVINECTCCNEKFGSNRRETAIAAVKAGRKLTPEEAGVNFTVQAAFINI